MLLGSSRAMAQAPNDDCAQAISASVATNCSTPLNGTVESATQSLPPTTGCGFNVLTASDVWYSFTATGTSQLITLAPRFGAIMDIRSGSCGVSASVFCAQVFTGNTNPTLVTNLSSGQTYFIRVYPSGATPPAGISSTFALCVANGPTTATNDDCAQAISVPVTPTCTTPTNGSVQGATQSLPPTTGCGFGTTATDVWYSFVASGTTQTLTLTTRFAASLDVRSGTCAASTSIFCTNFAAQGTVVSGLTTGQTYFIRIYPSGNIPPTAPNNTFTLCVTPGPGTPANDNCAGATPLPVAAACTPTASTIAGASQSLPPAACGNATTANDVWFSFQANGTTQIVTLNANFATVIDVRSGTCASSASVFCSTGFAAQGIVVSGLTSGQTYFMRVYPNNNTMPTPTNSAFTICVTSATPAPNNDCAAATPVPVTTACATPVNGTVVGATQSLPPSPGCGNATTAADVWYSFVASGPTQLVTLNARFAAVLDVRSGSCATSASVFCTTAFGAQGQIISGLTSGQTYFLRIYPNGNIQPTPTNSTFTLCINPGPTPPVNDECVGAIAVPVTTACTSPVTGTIAAASQSLPPTTNCGVGTTATDVWYSFVASASTQSLTLTTAQFQAGLDVRIGTCATSLSVFCATVNANQTRPTVVTGLFPGQTYYLRIYSTAATIPIGAGASFTLCITDAPLTPANDDCAGAINVPVQFGNTCVTQSSADNTAATSSTGAPAPTCAAFRGADLWFQVTVPPSGTLTVRTLVPTATGPAVNDTGMSIYAGQCGNLTELDCDDDGAGNAKSLIVLSGRTPGEVLYIRVWAWGGNNFGNIAVCATSPTTCPAPTAPGVGSPTATSAQLLWQPGGTPTAGTTYTVEYGPQGFVLGTGTVVSNISSSPVSITGLLPGTTYCYYVRQDCPGTTGSSAYVGPTCFSTIAVPANDEPCGAVPLPNGSQPPVAGSNVGATTSTQAGITLPGCAPTTTPQDVWFSFTPTSSLAALTLTGASAGQVRVFTTPDCATGPFTLVACENSGASNTGVSFVSLINLTLGTRYYVAVSGYGNGDTPGNFTIFGASIITGTQAQSATNALLVFPNPSSTGQLTLRLNNPHSTGQASLLNALGQVVLTKALAAGTAEQALSTRGLAAGLYTLRVQIGQDVLTRKVVLE
jgi:hypothetical protein